MKTSVTVARVLGLVIPLVASVGGFGCVNLDKPEEVAACASGKGAPCSDGDKKDATTPKDAGGLDTGSAAELGSADDAVTADTNAAPDGLSNDDAGSPQRADSSTSGPETGPDSILPAIDAGQPDTKNTTDAVPDAAIVADAPLADALSAKDGPGPDVADVATPDVATPDLAKADAAIPDTAPPSLDAGPSALTTFSNGKGVGLFSGYGWVSLGTADTVTSPTCGTPPRTITGASPCTASTNWSAVQALCVSGSLPPISTVEAGNWGIQVGVNATGTTGIGQAFKTVAVNVVGVPAGNDARIEIHRAGDADGDNYCAKWIDAATPVALISFNKACWDNSGVFLTTNDIPKIDKVGLQVSPFQAVSIELTNLCLQSITFAN